MKYSIMPYCDQARCLKYKILTNDKFYLLKV